MKEAIVKPDTSVAIQDSPVPTPARDEILVKVLAFGVNPKDWKVPVWTGTAANSGDDVAGVVEAVGEDVFEFNKGDRVAGFHVMRTPGGAFAEYAILPEHTTFHIPAKISFEEAATVPLTGLTAAFALFSVLKLPAPWHINDEAPSTPLVIYGASTAIGAYGIKLASAANIHPIIAVGSSTSAFIEQYLDAAKGDALVDYRAHETTEALVEAIRVQVGKSTGGGRAWHAYDAVTEPGTFDDILSKALAGPPRDVGEGRKQKPVVATVLPGINTDKVDPSVETTRVSVGNSHAGGFTGRTAAALWTRLLSRGLHEGWLRPHPHEVIPNGLAGLEDALRALKNGEVRGKKLVGRIADTPGL